MTYILKNIENKLKNSILNEKLCLVPEYIVSEKLNIVPIQQPVDFFFAKKKYFISFIFRKFLFNFLFFFSKNLTDKKKRKLNFILFTNFYEYFNTFFLTNKIFFYKKYFYKKNYNFFYLNKYFLNKKIIKYKYALSRLNLKRLDFYKKNIWNKNKKFRKRNILIFNKKFFKLYTSNRFDPFVVDSILPLFKLKKRKKIGRLRSFKKLLFDILHQKFYYLFLHKKYIFSFPRKHRKNKKPVSKILNYKTYSSCYLNRKFRIRRKRKIWRQAYHIKGKRTYFLRFLLSQINFNFFDKKFSKKLFKVKTFPRKLLKNKKIFKRSFKKFRTSKMKLKPYSKIILGNYLKEFCLKLAARYYRDKQFKNRFFLRRTMGKRALNVFYYFRWKKKKFFFHILNSLKKINIKKTSFNFLLLNFISKKFIWKKKKFANFFSVFYYNKFLLKNFFMLFNSFFQSRVFFFNFKRIKKLLKYRKKEYTYYKKKKRRFFLRFLIKKKLLKIFLTFLFLKFMKKHKNEEKFLILRNSFFYNKFKKIKLNLISSLLLNNSDFYFKNNCSYNYFYKFNKKNSKIFSLLKKNNF